MVSYSMIIVVLRLLWRLLLQKAHLNTEANMTDGQEHYSLCTRITR